MSVWPPNFPHCALVIVLWMICMTILHFFWRYNPHIMHHFSWFFEPVAMLIVFCMICMILNDHFSWIFMILHFWEVYPYIHHFSWFFEPVTLLIVLCSSIGFVEDKSVLKTLYDSYFNSLCYFEQVLSSKFPENIPFSSSRLHLSSCFLIESVEDRSVLMTIHDII